MSDFHIIITAKVLKKNENNVTLDLQDLKLMKNIIIASTSTIHGSDYLEYLLPELEVFFNSESKKIKEIIFIPYARPSGLTYVAYTNIAKKAFKTIGIEVKGIHEFDNPVRAINQAKGVFVGGGNTFELVNQLYKTNLMTVIKTAVENGLYYLGTSAGSNICGLTMQTTNDMPIVYPPSFKTLGLIDFNINPHYLDPNPNSTHKGETRETRINEYHIFNDTPVLGLREGSWLHVVGNEITLKGKLKARLFRQNQKPVELKSNKKLNLI
jgi:dipeptidase E